jgi:hypothetical protein
MRRKIVLLYFIIAALISLGHADAFTVQLVLNNVKCYTFIEWKVESRRVGERATGHLTGSFSGRHWSWDMGPPPGGNQLIWFWWDTLDGEADATVLVDGVIVFQGHCVHNGYGEQSMDAVCAHPSIFKTKGPGRSYYTEHHALFCMLSCDEGCVSSWPSDMPDVAEFGLTCSSAPLLERSRPKTGQPQILIRWIIEYALLQA